jgi:hypothetical protein
MACVVACRNDFKQEIFMTTYRTKTLPHPGKAFLNSARHQARMQTHCIAVASAAAAINSTY